MATQVHVNNRTVVHSGSGGIASAFPDPCHTPTPGGPMPVPYPNVARAADTSDGSTTVTCDGRAIMLRRSRLAVSTGDEAGSAGGNVVTAKLKGPAAFVMYSFDVTCEGQNVPRQLDAMLCNVGGDGSESGLLAGTPSTPCVQPGSPAAIADPRADDHGPVEIEWEDE